MKSANFVRIALIPAYEPVSLLPDVLRTVKDRGFHIVLVNDGSSEDKKDLFLEAEKYADVLEHKMNRGKGRALKTGMEYIKLHFPPDCTVVTMDADGQHTAEDAVKVAADAEENPGALILGSRKFTGNVPLKSLFGNTITRLVYKLSTGHKIYDTQTGLRAFNAALIPTLLNIQGERFEYEMNVLLELARKNIPIRETPIETIYIEEN
ncbi:MAG: glycosyltransferase family 2 protein, partial [Clostridia bacterium]|nr:glycosyltransferase family 2 protein [Clostridia bacterium]